MIFVEAYKQLILEQQVHKIDKTKFAELGPKHTQNVSENDHNICFCIYHANCEMLLERMGKTITGLQLPSDIKT